MKRTNRGFTLIEFVLVLLLGGVLVTIAMRAFGNVTAGLSVRSARDTFITLHAQARVRAVERGVPTILFMDFASDSATVSQGATLLETIHFRSEYNVDFQGPAGPLLLCMSPRGLADSGCTNFNSAQTVQFQFNAEAVGVRILPLGQLLY